MARCLSGGGVSMETFLLGIGALVVASAAIRAIAGAIRQSGLKEFSVRFRFETNEKPPKQLNH